MKIVGVNMGKMKSGVDINDGGCCLLENGEIKMAVAEERISRRKYAGGFEKALQYVLKKTANSYESIDLFAVSNYGDEPLTDFSKVEDALGFTSSDKVTFVPSHHLSHAYSAFWPSPFEKALIVVLDNEGNIIGKRKYEEHWKNSMERCSYYIGSGDNITLIDRDLDEENTPSIGEVYGNFTKFLGLGTYLNAGKTMGLSAYGSFKAFGDIHFFSFLNGKIKSLMKNEYVNTDDEIMRFGSSQGVDFGTPRDSSKKISGVHEDIAFLVQDRLERIILKKIDHLCEKTNIKNLCFAGGVAYNCMLNQKILKDTPVERIFVQPCAGDQGLCIGNVFYGYHLFGGKRKIQTRYSTYLGGWDTDKNIEATLCNYKDSIKYLKYDFDKLAQETAVSISEGRIVGWFQGRSEMGPRALGNRSILADPRDPLMKDKLNSKVKHRESFRPYAPSVLVERSEEFFIVECTELPYMIVAADVKEEMAPLIPSVVHVDGSARIQTVSKDDNPRYYRLIEEFNKITGIPVVLNTSFNVAGEPIVETSKDALTCFLSTNIDILVAGDYFISKKP